MTFPQPRFASLEFADRLMALSKWQEAMDAWDIGRSCMRHGPVYIARHSYRQAMSAINDVKYFARKAKANG